MAVGVETLALDVSFATAAEGLRVGLIEGKAPATLAQRLGETRIMAFCSTREQFLLSHASERVRNCLLVQKQPGSERRHPDAWEACSAHAFYSKKKILVNEKSEFDKPFLE